MATAQKLNMDPMALFRSPGRSPKREFGESEIPPTALSYYRRIEGYAQRIRSTRNVAEIVGILEEAMRETHALADLKELELACERIGQAEREIADLKAELEQANSLVLTDQLTGILNRRGLQEAYARESARSDRYNTPMCVAVIDLDNFKRINDRYGHTAGDRALVHLAKVMRNTLRPNDIIARYGGEEFVALLPDSDEGAAFVAVSRFQHALTARPIVLGKESVALAFSAGISRRQLAEAQASAIGRADAALLEAKRTGKDRIMFSPV